MIKIIKKRYKQPIVKLRKYGGFVLTSSGEGDPLKQDPSRADIYGDLFKEE